ncbi:MAG: Rrf2 family transcriptional regulator [Bacteroidetes bacterium GWE2_29_8]|nr:MAG: Rrf2 family transcriptional regulator [Bacteroidetes bacterium GWE2_29_8]OFY23071.1 MAG: Rrf2 family transcriptional regulator [Bacteroidetes bacterium GWF2_29_10]
MKVNTKTRYGIRAMIEIGKDNSGNGVFQKDISLNQQISIKYLDHIIHALKVAGLIINVKGKKSGYLISRPANKITMYDIHKAFSPEISVVECVNSKQNCEQAKHCSAQKFWIGLNDNIINHFKSFTLRQMIEGDIP